MTGVIEPDSTIHSTSSKTVTDLDAAWQALLDDPGLPLGCGCPTCTKAAGSVIARHRPAIEAAAVNRRDTMTDLDAAWQSLLDDPGAPGELAGSVIARHRQRIEAAARVHQPVHVYAGEGMALCGAEVGGPCPFCDEAWDGSRPGRRDSLGAERSKRIEAAARDLLAVMGGFDHWQVAALRDALKEAP